MEVFFFLLVISFIYKINVSMHSRVQDMYILCSFVLKFLIEIISNFFPIIVHTKCFLHVLRKDIIYPFLFYLHHERILSANFNLP